MVSHLYPSLQDCSPFLRMKRRATECSNSRAEKSSPMHYCCSGCGSYYTGAHQWNRVSEWTEAIGYIQCYYCQPCQKAWDDWYQLSEWYTVPAKGQVEQSSESRILPPWRQGK